MAAITLKCSTSDFESILQILGWLSAALRIPEQDNGPEVANATMVKMSGSYRIVTESRKVRVDGSRHCWTKLLDRAVIAQGFPIPDRGLGRGLEISLFTACQIVGGNKAIDFAGGPVISGLSGTMLPVRSIEEGIQWHLLTREPSKPMRNSLQELKNFSNRMTYGQTVPEIMKSLLASLADPKAKCYIGWHPKAISFAGADPSVVNYTAIRKSGLKSPGKRFQLKTFTLGFQQIVTAEAEMSVVPIQSTVWLQRTYSWLDDRLIQAARTRVLLYDVPTQRGWLFRTDEVLLHLLRYQLLPHQSVKLDTCDSIQETLRMNSRKMVQEGLTVEDIILDKMEVIERLQAELSNFDKDRYFSTKLFGFDFLQCATRASSFVLKEETLTGMHIPRSWVQYIHASETPVWFGGGFGELIGLNEDDRSMTCSTWRKMPCDLHLMAVTAQTMRQIYDEEPASQGDGSISLTHKRLFWDQGSSMLHEPCHDSCSERCCQRVQLLRTRGRLRNKQIEAPASLPETGAIIFGDPDMVKGASKAPKTTAVWQRGPMSKTKKPYAADLMAVTEAEAARGVRELTQIEEQMRQITT